MSLLSINAFQILICAVAVIILYIAAIAVLLRTKSGILPYMALILFPVIDPLGILLGNYNRKANKQKSGKIFRSFVFYVC
ncbi:hypothetical protein H9Q08_17710 [Chryseobacterium sp. PS-8]|uniref:Uncharacterized protein n=1 Tax=Chryseobacterium indicum TaxID=2766954 RepID=A0ABS9C9M9_9FLAO|nr:hypothetical protein [Chryseobacterium sp. PS-8]MCF2221126.1 hypothetical protein [Chryseobacterium sp. PS-8]